VLYNVASVYALQGEGGRALELLEKAIEKGYSKPRGWVENTPDLASLGGLPPFQALLSRL
jgi:hypothetical protein